MTIPFFAGAILGECFLRFQNSDLCPDKIKRQSKFMLDSLKEIPLHKKICTIICMTVFTHSAIDIACTCLRGRVSYIRIPAEILSLFLGRYWFSIPFFIGMVFYLTKKEQVDAFVNRLRTLYGLLGQAKSYLVGSLSNPDGLIARVGSEIKEGIEGVSEAAQSIMFAEDPEVIRTINQEIEDFERHLQNLCHKIPEFELKIKGCKESLKRSQEELAAEIVKMEEQSEQLVQLMSKIDTEYSGFWEDKLKNFFGYQPFTLEQEKFHQKLALVKNLAKKVEYIVSGIDLMGEIDSREVEGIKHWFDFISQVQLPVFENAFVTFWDSPMMIKKMINVIIFQKSERVDDLVKFQRQRIKLNEIAPEGISNFSQTLIIFGKIRNQILDILSKVEPQSLLEKDNWREERAATERGNSFLNTALLIFLETFNKGNIIGAIAASKLKTQREINAIAQSIIEVSDGIRKFQEELNHNKKELENSYQSEL